MKDNFQVVGDEFAFSCMIGDSDCGCLPADGLNLPLTSKTKWVSKGLWDYPNVMDFPVDGKKRKTSPLLLPPPCPDGYTGKHPNCRKEAGSKEFSGMDAWSADGDDDKSGGFGDKIDADTITAGLETTGAVIALLGSKRALSEVEGVCGKQPKPLIGGKAKKQVWAKCASDYMNAKLKSASKREDKGLSTGAIVGISLGAVAVVGGLIFLALKKPKTVVVQQAPVAPVASIVK